MRVFHHWVPILFSLSLVMFVASVFNGCSQPAKRVVCIHQFQSTKTYPGQFEIDFSQLPFDAIEKRIDSGNAGNPETVLTIKQDYEVKILLVPLTKPDISEVTNNHS